MINYTGRSTESIAPTTNKTAQQTHCMNINATQTEIMETFTCSPPDNESSSDSPARRRQHRSYQAIMKSKRLKQICNTVSVVLK
jgi:hypothetical protein